MKTRFLFLTATLALASTLAAQGRPSGDELYARYVEATGGKAALQKVTHRHIWGRFDVPAQGVSGPIEILTAAPMLMLTKIEIPGMGSTSSGYDGQVGWVLNPAMGPMLLEGKALDQLKQQADVMAMLEPGKYVASRQTTGEAQHDGKACWVVTVTTKWDEKYTECYDKESGLLSATTRTQVTPMGDLETTTEFSDYKAFDGIKMATTTRANAMGFEQVIKIDSMSTKPIPASVFEAPAQVKALKKP